MSNNLIKVISVTGGKGGIGKSFVSINLASSLASIGKRVLVFDADLGLANIDVLLGLKTTKTLADVISGESTLSEILISTPFGFTLIPASSGIETMSQLSSKEHTGIIHAFSELEGSFDILIIDTAAGISDSVVSFTSASHEVIIVVCNEPASIADAYALIKILSKKHGVFRFQVIVNMVQSPEEGAELFATLKKVTDNYLDVALQFMGYIPHDLNAQKAIRKRRPVVNAYVASKSSTALKELAHRVNRWPTRQQASGSISFFVENLLQNTGT